MNDVVRPAVAGDAEAVYEVHRASWLEAYTHLLPREVIEDRFRDRDLWIARWTETLTRTTAAVAERDARIVGWATASGGRSDDAPRDRELEGIYLLAEAQGSGLGQQLLDTVIGDAPAYLWVADRNPRAEAFYRRNGFERDGALDEHRVSRDGHTLPAVRMVR